MIGTILRGLAPGAPLAPCSLCALLDKLNQLEYISSRVEELLPDELVGVGSRAGVAASPADKRLSKVGGLSGDLPGGVLLEEGFE